MNLLATSLMTHAYLYAPSDKHKYKTWVLEYLRAWEGMLLHLTLAKRPRMYDACGNNRPFSTMHASYLPTNSMRAWPIISARTRS